MSAPDRWDDALTAAKLFAVDPSGLGGIAVRSSAGPVRDLWFGILHDLLEANAPIRRLPTSIGDDRLLGGVDLAATLKAGRPIVQSGILAEADGGIVVIAMAERLDTGIAARIASAMDRREVLIEREGIARRMPTHFGLVAFDEGASSEEQIPAALAERCAFHIELDGLSVRNLAVPSIDSRQMAAARARLASVKPASDGIIEALVSTSASFGIGSIVSPLLALRAARVAAALAGRTVICMEDAVLAARLVLAPRALMLPSEEDAEQHEDEPQSEPPPDHSSQPENENDAQIDPSELPSLEDVMLAAVQAALPDGLLESLKAGTAHRDAQSRGRGVGATQASLKRGRPVGVRMAPLRPGARLAIVETLRAAAPWQAIRRAQAKDKANRVEVRREDFRIKKFAQRREAAIIFCVDASGSTAFHRLAETKGAVELLLGEAYVARTHVALVVFRGKSAELLLPSTRSLARARALLADLPGGGGTPLAAGLDAAFLAALSERVKGHDPLVVVLTDGRANIARDGQADRPRATQEGLIAAAQFRAQRIASVFVDTSPRPRDEGAALAAAMGARYVALPYVEAGAVRDVVRASAPGLAPA
jgi:magnesium chelatase subunit D